MFDGRAPEPSMLNEFMKLVVNTDKALKQKERFVQGGYNFDDLISWQKSFHILKPITSKAYLAGFVTRLKNGCSGSSGNGIKIDEAKLAEGKITLKICSCENGRRCCASMLPVMCSLQLMQILVFEPCNPQALRLLPSRLHRGHVERPHQGVPDEPRPDQDQVG